MNLFKPLLMTSLKLTKLNPNFYMRKIFTREFSIDTIWTQFHMCRQKFVVQIVKVSEN